MTPEIASALERVREEFQHVDELLAALATPPGNATQPAGAREPLTPEKLAQATFKETNDLGALIDSRHKGAFLRALIAYARAIELAHGITFPKD